MKKILLLLLLCSITSMAQETPRKMIETAPDKNNQKVIKRYNRFYYHRSLTPSYGPYIRPGSPYTAIFGVGTNSTMSNDDIEVNVIKKWVISPLFTDKEERVYFVEIKNKTKKTIYIDKSHCFKILNDGSRKSYYDLKRHADWSQKERYIAIPPRSKKNLSDYRWQMSESGKYPVILEYPETFDWSPAEVGINVDFLPYEGDVRYTEKDSPYHISFVINYSKEKDFSTYSMVKIDFYIRQLICIYFPEIYSRDDIPGMRLSDKYTITNCVSL